MKRYIKASKERQLADINDEKVTDFLSSCLWDIGYGNFIISYILYSLSNIGVFDEDDLQGAMYSAALSEGLSEDEAEEAEDESIESAEFVFQELAKAGLLTSK